MSKVLQHAEIKNIEIYHLTRKIFQQREHEDPGNPDKAGRVKIFIEKSLKNRLHCAFCFTLLHLLYLPQIQNAL